ncbi:UDP-glycosyltransferase 89B2-like [Telopea speciosissima]|uniref:UDP-glycosyltransferase 89B2-like n=1 Tax=Telopea speciosissima TaxID=54955 RepID=UPI001CC78454|nr:UDP-glycosyltransferase 89B2-like [Telopea speciosissima]
MTIPCGGTHILVFPYPAQGHMLALLDLTHQLVIRGLTITILVTPKNLPILNPLLSRHPSSIKTLILPFPSHPSVPAGVENVKDLPDNSFISAMVSALRQLHDPLLLWFRSHPSPPSAIISDLFLGWTHHLACQLNIPRIVFSPSGAAFVSLINCLWRETPQRDDPNDPDFPVSFPKVPGSPIYPWRQLSFVYRSYVRGDPEWELIRDDYLANMASWGIVFNSFSELERDYLVHLEKDLGHDQVWAVGPLLPPDDDPTAPSERGGSNSISARDIISWLDKREENSVIYVCFGSQAVLSNEQIEALAVGLEQSGVHFIWCIKEATVGHVVGKYGVVPSGFEDRAAERGLVIRGWAPQVSILRHRAVGSFLTHCGWNSVLEGIVAGVALLAWPMTADQFADAKLLEEVGVGMKVCEGAETVPNSVVLAKAMTESVSGKGSKREKAVELQKAALDAIKEGGSSSKDLDLFVKDLSGSKIEFGGKNA